MKLSHGVNTDFQDSKYKDLTEKIIKVFYTVYNRLGYGFLEKVYEKAMMIELKKGGIPATSQSPIQVFYEDEIIGEYFIDILVDNKVIVEIEAAKSVTAENEAQLLNYLMQLTLRLVFYFILALKHRSNAKYSTTLENRSVCICVLLTCGVRGYMCVTSGKV